MPVNVVSKGKLELLSPAGVAARVGVSRTTIYVSLIPKHGFPRPLRVGYQVRWLAHEIDEWIKAEAGKRPPTTTSPPKERAPRKLGRPRRVPVVVDPESRPLQATPFERMVSGASQDQEVFHRMVKSA